MKIISKFKDYYDFIAGYDSDPRKVYMRKDVEEVSKIPSWKEVEDHIDRFTHHHDGKGKDFITPFSIGCVWFCDQFFNYLAINGRFYYSYQGIPEMIKGYVERALQSKPRSYGGYKDLADYFRIKEKDRKNWNAWYRRLWEEKNQPENLNKKTGYPIIFSRLSEKSYERMVIEVNGRLKDIEFSQVKAPAIAYTELYNWIPYHEPEMPNDPTDLIRYEGKGFDKKTSFRHPYK